LRVYTIAWEDKCSSGHSGADKTETLVFMKLL
jgi:hypothetical protein